MGLIIKWLMGPYTLVRLILRGLNPWSTLVHLRKRPKKDLSVPKYMVGKKKNKD